MTTDAADKLVISLAERLTGLGWMFATAESCTGGMIAAACTDLSGSSAWFDRGFVTYSNDAKADMLGIDPELIETHGAVSEAVAIAMAEGAIKHSNASLAVAVTGIAGPTGGSAEKPVGTVWFGFATPSSSRAEMRRFNGGRLDVRRATVEHALSRALQMTASS